MELGITRRFKCSKVYKDGVFTDLNIFLVKNGFEIVSPPK